MSGRTASKPPSAAHGNEEKGGEEEGEERRDVLITGIDVHLQ